MVVSKLVESRRAVDHPKGFACISENPSLEQRLVEAFGEEFAKNYEEVARNHPAVWSATDVFDEAFVRTYPDEMHVDVRALGSGKCRSRRSVSRETRTRPS